MNNNGINNSGKYVCIFSTGKRPEAELNVIVGPTWNQRNRLNSYRKSRNCWRLTDEIRSAQAEAKAQADANNNDIMYDNANNLACICNRPSCAYECGKCYQFFRGRLAEICPQHKSDIFLMDFQCCPYCTASNDMIKVAQWSWEEICKFEQAELPGGDEGL